MNRKAGNCLGPLASPLEASYLWHLPLVWRKWSARLWQTVQDFALVKTIATFMCKKINLHHCFTWTRLQWQMRFWQYRLILSLSPGLMDNLGTFSQRKSIQPWGNVQPLWLHYLVLLSYPSQPFPTWLLVSPNTVPHFHTVWTMQPWLTAFSASHQSTQYI